MIHKIFDLSGTTQQQELVKAAIDKIMFPWDRLAAPRGIFRIGWADLNTVQLVGKLHQGHSGEPDKIEGQLEGRRYVFGVFYPSTGDIYIDSYLINYPQYATETVSAEIAHLVDFFLPLTHDMKVQLHELMHRDMTEVHDPNDWWEKRDYGQEYYTLPGEAFMQAFTLAYSDMEFDTGDFTHDITKDEAPEVRRIMGIERTDAKYYRHFRGSKVYHDLDHYTREDEDSTLITDTTGLRPCKICKP